MIEIIQKSIESRKDNILKAFGVYHDEDLEIKKAWGNDLQKQFPNGKWVTINGSHVFIHDGKVVAGLEGFNGFVDDFFKEKDQSENKKRVKHSMFGVGTVLKEDNEKITVNFDKVGEKELLKKYARLENVSGSKEETKKVEDKKQPEKKKVEQKEVKKDESIKILKQTPKAYLLERNGVQFWVQKRWFNETTGKLTPAGEKSLNQGKERQQVREENSKPVFNDNFKIEGKSESGKATKISVKIDNGFEEKTVSFYVPNQAMEEKDGKVGIQKNMLNDKLQELNDKEGYVSSKPSKVTDKGIGFMVNIDYVDIEKDRGRVIWFPKSQVKEKDGNYFIPKWLYKKKQEELYDEIGKYEGVRPGGLGYISTHGGGAKVEWEDKFENIPVKLK